MSQYITEKIDLVSEGIMDSIFNNETSTMGRAMKKYKERFLDPQKGYVENLPWLATQAGMEAYDKALERGAGEGGVMGAFGGGALGAGLAGRGVLSAAAKGAQSGAESGKGVLGKSFKTGKGALAALIANLALKGAGAAVGTASGFGAGFAGGRQTGASILGAGAGALAGGPIAQPLAALLALGGGALGGQIASSIEGAKKKLSPGGPDQVIFRA
jgi:hypothetical protein